MLYPSWSSRVLARRGPLHGLVLAAVGLYGVLSYAVVRRTREIGIRLKLGAQPAAVVRSVIGRITIAACAGVTAGLAGGVYFATFVRRRMRQEARRILDSLGVSIDSDAPVQ